jgi:hypothetical protein
MRRIIFPLEKEHVTVGHVPRDIRGRNNYRGNLGIVADTNFSDIGRCGHICADGDTKLLIPRERNSNGTI